MAKSEISAITEVVPQISYDIIGRIIPGVTVIVSLIVAFAGPTAAFAMLDKWVFRADPPMSGWAALLLVGTAYVLGVVLDGMWDLPSIVPRLRERRDREAYRGSLQLDAVALRSQPVGARHTKLRAEISQAQALIAGWSVCAVINLGFLVTHRSVGRLCVEALLALGVLGAALFRRVIDRSLRSSLINHWLLLDCDKLLASTEPERDHP